jgi:hypothetical protein
MFVIGDIWMVDLGLKVELGGFERVVRRQDEQKLELSALGRVN